MPALAAFSKVVITLRVMDLRVVYGLGLKCKRISATHHSESDDYYLRACDSLTLMMNL